MRRKIELAVLAVWALLIPVVCFFYYEALWPEKWALMSYALVTTALCFLDAARNVLKAGK